MNTEQIIKWAQEAAKYADEHHEKHDGWLTAERFQFATLVAQAEREARQAAQAENEQLKAQIARSGVELRSAVLAERERILKIVYQIVSPIDESAWIAVKAHARYAPGQVADCADCDCADNEPCKSGIALESGEFIPAEKITDWIQQ